MNGYAVRSKVYRLEEFLRNQFNAVAHGRKYLEQFQNTV